MSSTIVATFLLSVLPWSAGMPQQDSLPSLLGSVRSDALDGFLTGAVVEVRQGIQTRRARVGQDGSYRFDGLQPGRQADHPAWS